MVNALTGDFDAVLQINVGTLRRLVANMHQNASGTPTNPTIPHVAYLRLDDEVTGHQGSIAAQIGVPHLHLINGATDRIQIDVGIRARYRADPGSSPLADLIHGTVRAEYRLHDIDPRCYAWRHAGNDFFWFRVVPESVGFSGTLLNESSAFIFSQLLDEPAVKAHLTKHLTSILANQFEPAPQRVNKRFQRIRSIQRGDGPTDAAIAIPYGPNTETPPGNLASVDEIFLNGWDFGLAVSADYIISKVQPMVEPLIGYQIDFPRGGPDLGVGGGMTIDYHVRVDAATAEWIGPVSLPFFMLPGGVIRIRLTGTGWASRLYRSGIMMLAPTSLNDLRMNFTIDQLLVLTFDAQSEFLTVSAHGAPIVSVGGGTMIGYIEPMVRSAITSQAQTLVGTWLVEAQSQLNAIGAAQSRSALIKQLKGLDAGADAHFTDAIFRSEGFVLCGRVSCTLRHRPQVSFSRTPSGDGFDAIESWIPGGQVDRFEWTWRWFTNPVEAPPGPPGSVVEEDSFLLQRPQGARSKFGMTVALEKPLPGLDGMGKVCLAISGVHYDPFTGWLVPVRSVIDCDQFGYEFKLPYEIGPYLRLCDPLRMREGPAPEIGVLRVGVPDAQTSSNTLVLYLDGVWNEEAVETLTRGLEACGSRGTGLLVLLLFRENAFAAGYDELQTHLRELRGRLSAPVLVAEDVRSGWSTTLALPTQGPPPAWRLLSPDGATTWAHDGLVNAELLAAMLDRRLVASTPPAFAAIRTKVAVGARLPIELALPDCPPLPFEWAGLADGKVIFVHKDSASARPVLEELRRRYENADDSERSFVAVVIEGADIQDVEQLRDELQLNVPIFPDATGALTRRAGVRLSPTTLTVDGSGVVTGFDMGVGDRVRDTDLAAEGE